MFSQPLCSLFARSYIVDPAVTRCNIHSELQRRRLELRDVSASGAAASSGGASDDPGPRQQQRNAPWSLVSHIFHHSLSKQTPTIFLSFHTPLLVCCALLFPLLLPITYTELHIRALEEKRGVDPATLHFAAGQRRWVGCLLTAASSSAIRGIFKCLTGVPTVGFWVRWGALDSFFKSLIDQKCIF